MAVFEGIRGAGAKRSRLWASTADCTQTLKHGSPLQRQRASPKQRFRYEMPASTRSSIGRMHELSAEYCISLNYKSLFSKG